MRNALKDALLFFLRGQTLIFSLKYYIKPSGCKTAAYPARMSMTTTSASLGAQEPELNSSNK